MFSSHAHVRHVYKAMVKELESHLIRGAGVT